MFELSQTDSSWLCELGIYRERTSKQTKARALVDEYCTFLFPFFFRWLFPPSLPLSLPLMGWKESCIY